MFKLFFICATRLGEFLGLQVGCFDYAKGRITIKQQIAHDGELTDRLKSEESYRTIALPKDICNMLQEYIEELGLNNDDYIFHTYDRKTPISRTTFRRSLYKYCDIAEVRKLNPHAIRHTMAVRLARVCKTGAELETAAKRMGHTTSVFLDIYANHKDDEIENDLLNRMLG
jgi:integrase